MTMLYGTYPDLIMIFSRSNDMKIKDDNKGNSRGKYNGHHTHPTHSTHHVIATTE
jgi:hypothetical protein